MKIEEYRKIMNDDMTSDEKVQMRIDFIEALCRNMIRLKLDSNKKIKPLQKSSK